MTFHLDGVHHIAHACFELIAAFEQRACRCGGAVIIDWDATHHRSEGMRRAA